MKRIIEKLLRLRARSKLIITFSFLLILVYSVSGIGLYNLHSFPKEIFNSKEHYNSFLILNFILIFIPTGLTLFGTSWMIIMIKTFINPVNIATESTKKLSSGEITTDIKILYQDEVGELLKSLQLANLIFQSVFCQILNVSNKIFDFSNSIKKEADLFTKASESLAQEANILSDSLVELNSSSEEINESIIKEMSNIKHLNTNITVFTNSMTSLKLTVNDLNLTTTKSFQEIKAIGSVTDEMVEAMDKIEKSSGNIQKVLIMIVDISKNTSLLALNASIEAARAGESGQGFAVVADEIASLAQRVSQEAKMIQNYLIETKNSVILGQKKVNTVSSSVKTILKDSEKIDNNVKKIRESLEEQGNTINEIRNHTDSMVELSEKIEMNVGSQKSKIGEIQNLSQAVDSEASVISNHSVELMNLSNLELQVSNFLSSITKEFKIDGKILIKWSDSLKVGIEKIDTEHKGLVNLINQLYEKTLNDSPIDELKPIFDSLVHYTVQHFQTEEDLFAKYNYPLDNEHKQEHENLKAKVLEFKVEFEKGNANINFELLDFLRKWLTSHILKSDMKYSDFFHEKGVF
ncbi:MAG: bacteriohemerythrin [Leptospiraceae bacterium]|nr:bacteriohemerythrin [Leptospiraceae bacterium]